jgi:heavy metal sensor kinase
MNHRSLPFRLGAWYALLISVTFICVGAGAFYGLQHYLRMNLRDSLRRRSEQVEQILQTVAPGTPPGAIAEQIETRIAPEFNNRFVRITRAGDGVVYRSRAPLDRGFDPGAVPADLEPLRMDAPPDTRIAGPQDVMIRVVQLHAPSGDYRVELGAALASSDAVLSHLGILLLVLLPVLIVCATTGGYLLVAWALRPVDRLSQTAEQLSLQNLAVRLPALRSGDALERLSIALNNMLERLRHSVDTSRRFLADASHELRTPLTIIKGELQELSSGAAKLTAAELHERVGSVLEEVDRLEHLVANLLSLSRLDAGDTQCEWLEVDLAALARNTAEQMRLMAEDRGIGIQLVAATPVTVRGDPGRIKQIIVNLLDNAIRFTASGGTVTLRVTGAAEGCVLEVADTGAGIPAAVLPRVFDRFFRVDDARSRADGGAGLGLSIVKSICTAHGAQVAVDSQIGHGSCFRVRFPQW